ncbi:hypothetical protein ABPG74_007327 [Tetrahymena malaccensis]
MQLQQQQIPVIQPVQVMNNNYQEQLLRIQRQQQMALMQNIQYDVPQNWTNETTHLRYSDSFLCYGRDSVFTQTINFGRIEFLRGADCKCRVACIPCPCCCLCKCKSCYDHYEIPYLFQNIPNQTCPIEIEMCCLKTALIRYKGTVIGKVEMLISGCCATSPRVVVKPINEARSSMVLIPIVSCKNKLDKYCGYSCKYPRQIQVLRNGVPFTYINNTFEENPCCTKPWSEKNAFFARGDVIFEPSMQTDEKILLVCGWIIQQAVMAYVI